MVVGNTKVVQVTNIAPQATKDQMQTLFGYLGKIEDIRLYPTIRDVSCPVQSRICYVKFIDSSTVGIAQHMTNTVFIDRALIVIPVQSGDIPDEYYALEMTRNGTIVPGFNVNEPKLPPHVSNAVQGMGLEAVITTTDPQLEANDLPAYPSLPVSYDSIKIEETRRTVLVLNVDPTTSSEDLIQHFSSAGEVKYLRFCESSDESGAVSHLLVEFTDQPSVVQALKMNGKEFKGRGLEIVHATQPIVKPQAKSNEAAQKEIEEAMSRFKEAQNMINASIEPVIGMLTKDKRSSRRSRSRSRGRRRRSRSRSRPRRSRSRRRRSRSRKSRSRERRKRSRSRKRTRSRSRSSRARRSRSKSKGRGRRDSRDKERKSRDRSKDRKREKNRKSKEKESTRSSSTKDKSKDGNGKKNDKDKDKEDVQEVSSDKKRSRSRSRSKRRSRSKDRKDRKDKDRKRSRSRGGKRTTSPSPRSSKKRSRSKSRDRKKDKRERKDKDKDKDKRERSRSRSKVPKNYDEEEKGFDSEKEKSAAARDAEQGNDKESSEKSDNMDISNSP